MINATHMLNTTVSLERRESTDDGMGGQSYEWNIVGVMPARISQPTEDELRVALQEEKRFTHRVFLEPEAEVFRGDQVVTEDGFVMSVAAVVDPSEPAYRKAMCVAIQEGY